MKKLISLLLVVCMLCSMLIGCGKQEEANAPAAENEDSGTATAPAAEFNAEDDAKYADVDAPKGFKIGFAYLPPTDTLSATFHKTLDYCAEQFGCEMFYVEWTAYDMDSILSGYENMIQAGCDAIICASPLPGFIDACNESGVYWATIGGELTEEILPMALASDYYLGSIAQDETTSGYKMAQTLYDAGCREVAFKGVTPGTGSLHDMRRWGFMDFVEEHDDMNVVVEALDSMNPTLFEEIIAAHGTKIDSIVATGADAALPAAIIAAGYENDIKYTTIDLQGDVRTDLDTGLCAGVACGQYPVVELAFMLLYNKLASDAVIMQDRSKALLLPYMWLYNSEDYDEYIYYLEGDVPAFTGDELKEMCLAYNPDATVETAWETLQNHMKNYSLDDVMTRHAELFN